MAQSAGFSQRCTQDSIIFLACSVNCPYSRFLESFALSRAGTSACKAPSKQKSYSDALVCGSGIYVAECCVCGVDRRGVGYLAWRSEAFGASRGRCLDCSLFLLCFASQYCMRTPLHCLPWNSSWSTIRARPIQYFRSSVGFNKYQLLAFPLIGVTWLTLSMLSLETSHTSRCQLHAA